MEGRRPKHPHQSAGLVTLAHAMIKTFGLDAITSETPEQGYGLTVSANGNIEPFIPRNRRCTSRTAPSWGLIAIGPRIPRCLIVDVLQRLFPISERSHFRLSDYHHALVNQFLYAFRGFFAVRICFVESSVSDRGLDAFEMDIVLDDDSKASKGRVEGCFGFDSRSEREAGELVVGASQLEWFERIGWTDGDE